MAFNGRKIVGPAVVQLTNGDAAAGVTIVNEGPGALVICGAPEAVVPDPFDGFMLRAGDGVPSNVPLAAIFPGVPGVKRLFAYATIPGTGVFVSHA